MGYIYVDVAKLRIKEYTTREISERLGIAEGDGEIPASESSGVGTGLFRR